MKTAAYIEYLAHMLDESFTGTKDLGDRSYYAIWKHEFPEYSNYGRLTKLLAKRFDRYLHEKFGGGLERRLEKFAQAWLAYGSLYRYGRTVDAVAAAFDPETITDTSYFWEQIPARVYKALISRNRARKQGQSGYEISSKTIKDCLDNICCSAAILVVHSDYDMEDAFQMTDVWRKIGQYIPENRIYSYNKETSIMMVSDLYLACSSLVPFKASKKWDSVYADFKKKYEDKEGEDWYDNHFDEIAQAEEKMRNKYGGGQWLCNSTDCEAGTEILDEMKTVDYDICDRPDDAVPLISRIVDRMHIRGDLAGAFVEGGALTCAQTSNMKPDEIW